MIHSYTKPLMLAPDDVQEAIAKIVRRFPRSQVVTRSHRGGITIFEEPEGRQLAFYADVDIGSALLKTAERIDKGEL